MTPEKLRLMKALQLREKKKRAGAVPQAAVPSVDITPSPAAETSTEAFLSIPEEGEIHDALVQMPLSTDTESELTADEMAYSKADSAHDTASTAPTDHTSEHTQTDSRPHSPNCASSEVGDSTKASSVSESTDGTVHPQGDDKADGAQSEEMPEEEEEEEEEDPLTHEISAGETDGKAISPSELAEGSSVEGLTISSPSLGQLEHSSGVPDAELASEEAAKCAQGVSDIENNLVPTSKFAANLPSGQAVMDPLEIRGQDPPNVTSGPGRIDEADPGDVGPLQRTEDGTSTTSSKWNLPTSKYSTLDSSKCSTPSHTTIATSPDESLKRQDRSANASDKMVDDGATDEKRRSGRPEPLLTNHPDLPEKPAPQQDEPATVELPLATNDYEDAMSTMVHSPVTETPPQLCEPPTPRILRTVSSPVASPHSTVGDTPLTASRSISSGSMAFHQKMNQQHPSTHLVPRTPGKLAGGLASRIKAFEQLSTKNPPVVPVTGSATGRPSSAFFSIRQNSVRDGARSPSVLERTNSIYRGRTATPDSLDGSPELTLGPSTRSRSGSVASRMSVFEGGNAPRGRPETVQVTAKIVREPGLMFPKAPGSQADTSEYGPMELKQSPLIVDHRKSVDVAEFVLPANAPPVPTPLVHAGERRKSRHERTLSKESKASITDDSLHRPGQRTSLTMARDFIRDSMAGKDSPTQARPPSVHQSSSLLSRLSINTRRKSIPHDPTLLSPTETNKSESGDENKSKEGSRASRLMHRISSTFSPGRKQSVTTSPPILAEEFDAEESQALQAPQTSHGLTAPATPSMSDIVANLGDVNVQFPENLLWKRRTTYLDSTGFLHLTPAQGAVSAREKQLKRFHMSDFKAPYAPEIEFQELANSVCLDLKSGSGLQIAFQDRAEQLNGLQILQEAHQKHTQYGQ
ncbi:hypothetical protein BD289DRAFT_284279 [Coniella lustricola]|uniref:GPI-anchored cell surface glycoprotein n=1 Tax=Coniella lustricola TaxID=2025994 RepID=A0A2T3AK03_9PEZI|nr:hypothetical protein BD289DRAFT_284279 [Coniella lustricola]